MPEKRLTGGLLSQLLNLTYASPSAHTCNSVFYACVSNKMGDASSLSHQYMCKTLENNLGIWLLLAGNLDLENPDLEILTWKS